MDDRCGHESYNETDLTTPAYLIWNRDTKRVGFGVYLDWMESSPLLGMFILLFVIHM